MFEKTAGVEGAMMAPTHNETAPESEGRQADARSTGGVQTIIPRGDVGLQRVAAFVDGFNLYNGVKAKYGRKYLWLDLRRLAVGLLRPGQLLSEVIYCTARVRNDPERERQQSTYLQALVEYCDDLTIVEGRFGERHRRCRMCGASWVSYEEKESDVNLATALVEHAVTDRYDVALLVSGDGDLCPALWSVKRLRPGVRVVACFPPSRWSQDLRAAADASLVIGEGTIRNAQLPPQLTTGTGVVLRRPTKWR